MAIAAAAIAAVGLGVGMYKMHQGNQQKKKAKREERRLKANKPEYVIPEEIKRNLRESELRALEGLPTEQKKEYIRNLEKSQQGVLQSQAERKGGLLGIQSATQQANDAFTNLVSMDAAARQANQQVLQQNRLMMAAAKDKQFGFKEGRYQQELQSVQAMYGAGMQNQAGGIDMMASSAMQGGQAFAGGQGGSQNGN